MFLPTCVKFLLLQSFFATVNADASIFTFDNDNVIFDTDKLFDDNNSGISISDDIFNDNSVSENDLNSVISVNSDNSDNKTQELAHIDNPNDRSDIMQLWEEESEIAESPENAMRNALKATAQNRWNRYTDSAGQYKIPYVITGSFTSSQRKIIEGAMSSIAKNTCIRFVKRKDEYDYVDIQNKRGEGCYAIVGRIPGKNVIMLEAGTFSTCVVHETVIHELMHTIGLWHEQMRYDRDQYIHVHYENIPQSLYPQFKKVPKSESTTYGVKYDYYSVMHYTKNAFAKNPRKITMETKDPKAQEKIGKAKDASPGDYTKICAIYKCSKCMSRNFKGTNGQSSSGSGPANNKRSGKGGKNDGKRKRGHHGRRGGNHRGSPGISGSLSDILENIENMFNFKSADKLLNSDENDHVGSTSDAGNVGTDEITADNPYDNVDVDSGYEDDLASLDPFENDFNELLQNDNEIDVEHDPWASNWLSLLHRDFPSLSDTWEIEISADESSTAEETEKSGIFSIFHLR